MRTQFGLDERHDAAHSIDLAPMLDFVVNLLIFFIVTAVFLDGLTVNVRALRANVERLRAVDEHAGLVIVAAARAPMGALISVVDQVHLGSIYNITFTTTE